MKQIYCLQITKTIQNDKFPYEYRYGILSPFWSKKIREISYINKDLFGAISRNFWYLSLRIFL